VISVLPHPRVVNAAYFSPTGHKILTTCQDNRLRVWENAAAVNETPDKEIVHSHDFNRWGPAAHRLWQMLHVAVFCSNGTTRFSPAWIPHSKIISPA
jgi:WD40 repeat protein